MDDEILQALEAIKRAAGLAKLSNRRGTSYLPYYTDSCAEECAEILRVVTTTGAPRLIPSDERSLSTIRNRWYQGLRFLLENLDPDKSFFKMAQNVIVKSIRHKGVLVKPRPECGALRAFMVADWKPDLIKFIESARVGQKFERLSIPLSDEDLSYVRDMLAPVKHLFISSIDKRGIRIIRYDSKRTTETNSGTTG